MSCGKKIIMPHVTIFRPSLTIIMDNGDQYFKKIMSKKFHNATCYILING